MLSQLEPNPWVYIKKHLIIDMLIIWYPEESQCSITRLKVYNFNRKSAVMNLTHRLGKPYSLVPNQQVGTST